jgi:predicted AAA+ superfamily ATPase
LVPRFAQSRLAELVDAFRIVIVNGPRQSGKTTLLRLFEQDHGGSFRSLDEATTLRSAIDDPAEFARFGATPRVIDEIQRGGDDLVLAIKYQVDMDNSRGQYVLAGSTRFLTVPNLSESLAGRAVFVYLWPLAAAEMKGAPGDFCDLLFAGRESFAEAGASSWARSNYLDLICTGGYPEAVEITSAQRRAGWFDSYINTVVLRDVGNFAQVQHGELVPRLLAMLAARAGSPVVLSDLAQSLQLNQATVRNYLFYLDTVFLASRVPPWSSNLTARIVKTAKILPTDSGLASHLLEADAGALAQPGSKVTGILVETFVFAELTRLLAASDVGASIYFYRDHDGREVDFVLEQRGGRVVGIEVKSSSTVSANDFRHLRWLRDRLGDAFVAGYVLYLGPETLPFGDRMTALPLSTMWHHKP